MCISMSNVTYDSDGEDEQRVYPQLNEAYTRTESIVCIKVVPSRSLSYHCSCGRRYGIDNQL